MTKQDLRQMRWRDESVPDVAEVRIRVGELVAPYHATRVTTHTVRNGDVATITITVTGASATDVACFAQVTLPHPFGVGMYEQGVVQRFGDQERWVAPESDLLVAYAMSQDDGSYVIRDLDPPCRAICQWLEPGFGVGLVIAGTLRDPTVGVTDGRVQIEDALEPIPLARDEVLTLTLQIASSRSAAPLLYEDAVEFSDPIDSISHALAIWGSTAPSLGSLEHPGSTYPTTFAPVRAYGTLHTFFDPDAWNTTTSLAYSGVEFLQRQARDIIARALDRIQDDGLVPHHFDGGSPVYVAISGSPQPGPNLFIIECAIDTACATGDIEWFRAVWDSGLRKAVEWLLNRLDVQRGLLDVDGSLWVDVFRRGGFTLDTNSMAVRTFARAAEAAEVLDDPLAEVLATASSTIKAGLQALWADSDDHFVTSRSSDWADLVDHLDTENYLAIASGVTTPEQSSRIVRLFDSNPLTHPGGRGTFVSLIPYEAEDCFGGNVGDSDVAMGRLWWADLLARRRLRDDSTFRSLFEPVRQDLLNRVWMRERYSKTGELVRPDGYHEYPDLIDYLIREGLCGLNLGMRSVEITPMREGSFYARWGRIHLSFSDTRVHLSLADDLERTVLVARMQPGAEYMIGDQVIRADSEGRLGFTMRSECTVKRVR